MSIICFLLLAALAATVRADPVLRGIRAHIQCTYIWKPVCCYGTLYSNDCLAGRMGYDVLHDCTPGGCEQIPPCHKHFISPVCCEGNREYDNQCLADIAGARICQRGRCPVPGCPSSYRPVCCQGNEYTNQCKADLQGYDHWQCSEGRCPAECPTVHAPVCCQGNQEFSNACLADRADAVQCVHGRCDIQTCPRLYDPVCCHGQNFSNQCWADKQDYDWWQCQKGTCSAPPSYPPNHPHCPNLYDPVCCAGGSEYRNQCEADFKGQGSRVCSRGRCMN